MGRYFQALLWIIGVVHGLSYAPHHKDYYVSDYILQDMVNKLSKDLSVAADDYLSLRDTPNRLQANKILANPVIKDLDNGEANDPIDFEGLTDNPSPTIRDQEYLHHSSLWGHKPIAGGTADSTHQLNLSDGNIGNHKQEKPDALPAYCNPPNPCPLGYTTEEGCILTFENTAAFSRDYQRSQDCMCDSEHMFECSETEYRARSNDYNNRIDLDRMMEELSGKGQHKNLVAKKYHFKKNNNPYLVGDRLPVAAKKGINLFGG